MNGYILRKKIKGPMDYRIKKEVEKIDEESNQ